MPTVKISIDQKQLDKAAKEEMQKLEKALQREQKKNRKLKEKIAELEIIIDTRNSDVERAQKIIDAVCEAGDLCTQQHLEDIVSDVSSDGWC